MNKLLRPLAALAVWISCCQSIQAQSDSTYLDLGRVKIRKVFAQTVTIKGEDLQRIPFVNFSDAISVWFHGAFTNTGSVMYVVDGVVNLDPNALSIDEIAEITLVQHAYEQLEGINGQQQLVLIKTRRGGPDAQGVSFSWQSGLAKTSYKNITKGENAASAINGYHQYNISAYKRINKIMLGGSMGWLRDVYPAKKDSTLLHEEDLDQYSWRAVDIKTETPENLERFRFKAYATVPIGRNHTASLDAIHVSQFSALDKKYNDSFYFPGDPRRDKKYALSRQGNTALLNLSLNLHSKISNSFQNNFRVSFNSLLERQYKELYSFYINAEYSLDTTRNEGRSLVIENHLTYALNIGQWSIEPTVNFMARHIKEDYYFNNYSYSKFNSSIPDAPDGIGGGTRTGHYRYREGKVYLMTPSLNIHLRDDFNVQAGMIANVVTEPAFEIIKYYPFASLSMDLLGLIDASDYMSWKLFASYAERGDFYDKNFLLTDLTRVQPSALNNPYIEFWAPLMVVAEEQQNWQLGSTLSLLSNKLTFSYHLDKYKWNALFVESSPFIRAKYDRDNIETSSHRFGISTHEAMESTPLKWSSQLHASIITNNHKEWQSAGIPVHFRGYVNDAAKPWSFGWTNRFSYENLTFGFDVLGSFNQTRLQRNNFGKYEVVDDQYSSIALQNIYLGYQFQHKALPNGAEAFVNARNLTLNGNPNLQDTRSYAGLGFRFNL